MPSGGEQKQHIDWVGGALAQYEGPLLRYALRFTDDLHRARDVVQDTFLKLCHQQRTRLEGRLAPWLFKVCRNRALETLRKDKRLSWIEEGNANPASRETDESPAQIAERQDMHREVLELVNGLPPRQQEVIRLKFQEGMSYKEIADVTDLSVTNVGFIIHTAIKRLRRQILRDDPVRGGKVDS